MPGLFVRNHAQMVADFATISVVYVHGVERASKRTVIEHTSDEGILTWRIYYPVPSLNFSLISQLWKGYLFIRANCTGIRHAIRKSGKPALIHVHILTRLGIIALILNWRYRIPYLVTEHWSRYLPSVGTFNGGTRKWFTRLVVKRAAAVTTPTMNLQKAMRDFRLHNGHYFLLPNLVDTDRFTPAPARAEADDQPVQFVHVSCFEDRSKNISGLLRVVAALAERRKDFRCLLVGVGEDFEALSMKAEELGIKDRYVFFSGLLEGDSLVHAISTACFMVITSHYENLPVVIGEAFSCGIPVLSTNVGGISEIIAEHNGRLVKARDDQALLEGIDYMLDHCHEYDQQVIRDFAIQKFSRKAVTGTLKSIYLHALQKS
jgi:glycosyltransferase involved in cell wall biosynthesis